MRYRPLSSVIADFTFSISTGLAASTVTPGITAPEVSFTVPVNTLCARASAGTRTRLASTKQERSYKKLTRHLFPQSADETRLPLRRLAARRRQKQPMKLTP